MMLTADIALLKDPVYLKWVKFYAANQTALTNDFGHVWYKLMTRGLGPVNRCLGGSKVPPAQVRCNTWGILRLCLHCCKAFQMICVGV